MWAAVPTAAREVISRDIGRDERQYAVTHVGARLVARNSAVSATFGVYGATVRDDAGLSLRLGLEAIGRGQRLIPAGLRGPVAKSNVVTYSGSGIRESYTNGPLGVEQAFRVDRPVDGSGELTLVVGRVPAGAQAAIGPGGTSLTVKRGTWSRLRYSNLGVSDASGRRLPARIALSRGRILVLVDDVHARYPLLIDPTVDGSSGASLMATGRQTGGSDVYGFAVAISQDGTTIAVGAPNTFAIGIGAVYVFTRPAGGWQDTTVQTATLNIGSEDGFGLSVAISADGGTIVVGAPVYFSTDGSVYLFSRPGGGWQNSSSPTSVLTASDSAPNDELGRSVAISADGSTVVAGAPDHASDGAAYVFTEPTNGWQATMAQTSELTASDGASSDGFGSAVSTSGDGATVVVGAPATVDAGVPVAPSGAGAAYVFSEPPNGWAATETQTAELTSSSSQTNLGASVAISSDGGTIVANGSTTPVEVFSRPASGPWQDGTETADLPEDDADGYSDSALGVAVSPDGGTIVVGSLSPSTSGAGGAEVFTEPSGGWQSATPTRLLGGQSPPQNPETPSVGIAGDGTVLVGSDGSVFSGQVRVFPPAPVESSPPTVTGEPLQGQTLTESHGSWANSANSYSYQWEDCNTTGANCTLIPGATGQSYTLTNADAGHTIVVQETASNIGGTAIPASSAPTAVVTPLPPTSTAVNGVPKISGTVIEGNTLTAPLVSWTNTPSTVSYQWEDCDSTGQTCMPIADATERTYTLAVGDVGYRIVVGETAANSAGSSAPVESSATSAVPESGPVGLEIDDGDYATDDPHVTIESAWPPGTQSILISNNGGFRTDVETVAPAATIPWTLQQTGIDRLPKTVYLRFLGVGQDDINFTDDIILDETAPTIQNATLVTGGATQASAARATKLKTYRLKLKAEDTLVGVCRVATSQSRSDKGEVVTQVASCVRRGIPKVSRTMKLQLRFRPRFVRVRNSAGDWSRWATVKG